MLAPCEVIVRSQFKEAAFYEHVLQYMNLVYSELTKAKQAYQRERTLADRAMTMGEAHKARVESLEGVLAQWQESRVAMEAHLEQTEKSAQRYEQELTETQAILAKTQVSTFVKLSSGMTFRGLLAFSW